MELWKNEEFMRAKLKYEESCKNNNKQQNKELLEIKVRQSIKNINNFKKVLESI